MSDVRIDKWLWAARFFKTRQLAIDAIDKGKVKLSSGERIKPSRNAKLGERLHIDNGADEWDVLRKPKGMRWTSYERWAAK